MKHEYIEQHQIVDRYLMGRLSPDEVERFEEHYFSCQACIDQIELSERFQRGLRRAAGEETALSVAQQLGVMAWLARLGRRQRLVAMTAAAMMVALLLLPSAMLYRKLAGLQHELESNQQQLADSGQVDALRQEIEAARQELAAREHRSRQELAEEQAIRRELSEQLTRARQPQANTAIFSLQPTRSLADEPAYVVRLAAAPEWIVLSLELELPQYQSYRVSILRMDQSLVWQGSDFQPSHLDTLVLSLHSSLLEAGDYLVQVAGQRSGSEASAASFSFRVIRSSV